MKEKTLSIYKVARKYTGNINFIYNSMYNIWEQAILLTIQYFGAGSWKASNINNINGQDNSETEILCN